MFVCWHTCTLCSLISPVLPYTLHACNFVLLRLYTLDTVCGETKQLFCRTITRTQSVFLLCTDEHLGEGGDAGHT